MRVLNTPNPKWLILLLAAGVALAATAAGSATGEDPPSDQQSRQRIDRLIEELGHEDYFVRQRAQEELAELSYDAFDALNEAVEHEDLEIATRARHLLGLMRMQWVAEDDPLEVQAILTGYGSLNQSGRLTRIRLLIGLPELKGIPALCRVVRYEGSLPLAKLAALELLDSRPPGEPPEKELAELLRKDLGSSRRAAASWLLTWVRFADDAAAACTEWGKLVEAENTLLGRTPTQANLEMVSRLIRFQVPWLQRLNREDQATAAMYRLADIESGSPAAVIDLLLWLVEQQAWDATDRLAERFPDLIAGEPLLLYGIAQAQAERGDSDRAEQTARRALALNPGDSFESMYQHLDAAVTLWQQGRLEWAEREFHQIIDGRAPANEIIIQAYYALGEMLHDQGEELKAAETLKGLFEGVAKLPVGDEPFPGQPENRARMCFFFACHFEGLNDRDQQRKYLDEAIAADPGEVDVLIARYRLPDQTPEYRQETVDLIGRAGAQLRLEISQSPDDPAPYNEFAWLVANTEGDLEAALKSSKRSLELHPGSGALYDTLAHVYFAQGDYENAMKAQTKAVELEPYSKQITRKLEVFRRKWEEAKKQGQP
jgi:tetratricopeptide (TPR) repeat protein